ncbi:MAG: thioredoxin family protein [Rhodobacteraceae bacterium]|nr:thioredoxin family protein [Paracoccaceae bacterium]
MHSDEHLSLYGYALLLTGVILASSLYLAPPQAQVTAFALDGQEQIEEPLNSSEITTASIEPAIIDKDTPQMAGNWNYPAIRWRSYRDGLAEMERSGKPGLLVLQQRDCVLCRSYQRVFRSDYVTAFSDDFVFILSDAQNEPAVQQLYDIDGDYLPRTFVLSPDGGLVRRATSAHPRQRFFVDPHRPEALSTLLQTTR